MKKAFILLIFIIICFSATNAESANADMGPKPSVIINFSGLENQTYYVTLLSKTQSTGPWSAGTDYDYFQNEEEVAIDEKFNNYEDNDGYYFLHYFEKCQNNSPFTWGYYPPKDFKILIYFPGNDTFSVSGSAYQRYAFDSYYKVDMKEGMQVIQDNLIIRDYDYTVEILSLAIRIILTIAIEIAIAFLFNYRNAKYLKIIVITNLITQIALNIMLNIVDYFNGPYGIIFLFIPFEFFIFVIEAIIYYIFINKLNINKKISKGILVLYAFAANLVSFIAGLMLYNFIPKIF